MYESFYGFKEKPFQIIPDPNFLYLSPNHENALKYVEYGIERNIGIFLLTGEVGSGKTTLIKYLAQQIGQNIEAAIISNTNLPADQLLPYILSELGIEHSHSSKVQNLNIFRNYLKHMEKENRRTILIVDEAQNLPKDTLEELRMLSNLQADNNMPLQIFLVGQPELRNVINSPGMNQIKQRIAVNYHLKGLSLEETINYILYRLKKAGSLKNPFNHEAVALIHKATAGIPRSINQLCDSALLYGFADELKTIDKSVVLELLKGLEFKPFSSAKENNSQLAFDSGNIENETKSLLNAPIIQSLNDLVNKMTIMLKQSLDRIEFKIDQLRDEVRKTNKDTLFDDRNRYEKLLVESTRLKIEYEKLKDAVVSKEFN
jgi:putative secretion ATPase (PEP-CTERM system associated)